MVGKSEIKKAVTSIIESPKHRDTIHTYDI